MNQRESFSNSSCTDQIHLAERELSAFIAVVAELFGLEQARVSAEGELSRLREIRPVKFRGTVACTVLGQYESPARDRLLGGVIWCRSQHEIELDFQEVRFQASFPN